MLLRGGRPLLLGGRPLLLGGRSSLLRSAPGRGGVPLRGVAAAEGGAAAADWADWAPPRCTP
jgi:hypothetical protein